MIPSIGVDVLVSLADQITAPLRDVEGTIAKASDRMNNRLALSMKLAGAGAVAGVVAEGARRMVTGFTDGIRDVEVARGELATLGVRDLEVITRRAQEMQMTLVGVTSDAFVRASYDIKSGISSLTDEGVADMTAAAMWTAKATRGIPEQMTSLFATSYGIFKDQYAIMSDADFGNMFGAALSASVQQFKTDGAAMQAAIESAGAGAVNLGMKMTEQLALLGMMQQTMQAGEAGTALRAFATNAAKAHEGFADLAAESGNPIRVRILDENGGLRAMPDILGDLQARYGETLDAFEAAEIKAAFGTDEAMKMINALYGQEAAVRANAEALEEAASQGADFTEEMARAADIGNRLSGMDMLTQKMDVVRQMIGERLLPVIDRIVPYLDIMIATTFDWIDANPELVTQIGMVVAGLGAFLAIVAPILIGTSMMVSGWATIAYGATRLGLALLSLPRGLLALLNPMKLVRGALFALRVAVISTGIGAIVVGIAMAGLWIYKNWGGLAKFFQGFGKAFMAALGPAAPAISGIMSALGDLIGWVGSLFGPLDASAAQWEAWGESVGGYIGGLVAMIGDIFGAITSFDWSSLLTLDGLRAAWAGIVRFVSGVAGRIWDAIKGVEWASFLPLDALRQAWAAITGFLGPVLGAVWDALSPLSWLGLVKSEDLAGAWASVTAFVSGTASKVWDAITGMDWPGLLTLDGLRSAWAGITGFLGGVLGTLFDALHPLSWLGLVKSEDLAGAWASVTAFVSGTASKVWDVITTIAWLSVVGLDGLRTAWGNVTAYFSGITWSSIVPEWDWTSIIPFYDLGARLFVGDQMPVIDMADAARQSADDHANFDRGAVSPEQLALLERMDAWRNGAHGTPEISIQISDPDTLLKAAAAASELEARFPAIDAAASATLGAVQAALAAILAAIKAVDMTSEGARIAQSIANGMLAQLGAVRSAANQISATIRNAIPGNASVNVALSGVPTAPIQARAKGGSFRPGWLMTGEEGPELEYRTEGGFIAHNRALRGMVEMASRAREIAQGITMGDGSFGGAVPTMATVAASGGGSQRQAITHAPQYNMPLSFAPGVDMDEVRATVRAELMDAEERAMAAMRGLLHD